MAALIVLVGALSISIAICYADYVYEYRPDLMGQDTKK